MQPFTPAALAAATLVFLMWIYLLVGRGRFWRVGVEAPERVGELQASVAVIIPARNEATFIEQNLLSLLEQTCNRSLHIFLVDDGSTDATVHIARQAARKIVSQGGGPASFNLIQGQPLPPGWSGKLWAMQQGIEEACRLNPTFFLFSDADVVHRPQNVAALVAIAQAGGYDLASFMVKLNCQSFAEKLLVPAFVYFFFQLYPPSWIADPHRSTAGAAGGCLLIRPEALARAGGLEAIRNEIIDDCSLARAVKGSGSKVWVGLTDSARSIRPYGSFRTIGRMISRNAFSQLRHSTLLLAVALLGLTITYLLPPALMFTTRTIPALLAAVAWALMTITYFPLVRFYRLHPLWALTLPVTALLYMAATLHSAVSFWRGRGGQWKGRVQDQKITDSLEKRSLNPL